MFYGESCLPSQLHLSFFCCPSISIAERIISLRPPTSIMMSVEHLNAEENAAFSHILCKSRPPQGSASGGHTAYRHYAQTDTPHFPCLTAHATKIPGLVFVSGQTPIDGAGNLVQGSIQDKTVGLLLMLRSRIFDPSLWVCVRKQS